jgi:hypothetical protein
VDGTDRRPTISPAPSYRRPACAHTGRTVLEQLAAVAKLDEPSTGRRSTSALDEAPCGA